MILIVDDEPGLLDVMRGVLEDEGYRVETAENGAKALELLNRDASFCLAILDLMMPVMSGYELRRAMARDERLSEIPVAIASAYVHPGLHELRVAETLEKPFELDDLVELAGRYCGRGRSVENPTASSETRG